MLKTTTQAGDRTSRLKENFKAEFERPAMYSQSWRSPRCSFCCHNFASYSLSEKQQLWSGILLRRTKNLLPPSTVPTGTERASDQRNSVYITAWDGKPFVSSNGHVSHGITSFAARSSLSPSVVLQRLLAENRLTRKS